MKSIDRIKGAFTFIFIILFLFINCVPTFALNTSLYQKAALVLKEKGIMSGDTKGNLNLDKPLKRSEIAKMMIVALNKQDVYETYKAYGKSSFKDVSTSHWALGYIEAAKALKVISGYTDGTFKPEQYLKFEELTALVVRAMGVQESEVKGKWPLNYINKGYDLNLFKGIESEVAIGMNISRGQTAVILYNAFFNEDLISEKPVSIEYIDKNTVKVTFDKAIKTFSKSNFSFGTDLKVIDIRFADSTRKVVLVTTSDQKEGTQYTLSYKGQYQIKYTTKETPFDLAEEISIDSLKRVLLKFNKQVEANSLDAIKVYINEKEDATCQKVLSSDKKEVNIIFTNRLNQTDKLKVVINNLISSDGKRLTLTKEITAIDAKMATVAEFKVINSKKFKVVFSEPIDASTSNTFKVLDGQSANAMIRIDGSYIYAKVTPKYEENALEIETYIPLQDGKHTVEILDVKDFAGYKAQVYTTTITTQLEKNPPKAVSLNYITNNKVQIVFDEEINQISNVPLGEFLVYQASDPTNFANNAKISLLSDQKTVEIEFAIGYKFDVRALTQFEVKFRNVEDLLGNKDINWQSISAKAIDDTTKPQISKIEVLDGNIIKVTFSENVDAKNKNTSFRLYKSDGQTLVESSAKNIQALNEKNGAAEFLVEFNTLSNTNGGSFILKVSDIKDVSIRENPMDEVSTPITAKDTIKPLITAAVARYDAASDNDKIEIIFSEPINADTLNNLSSYFIGNTTATIPLSSVRGAKIDYVSPSRQRVTLLVPGADDTIPNKWSTLGGAVDRIAAPTLKDDNGNFLGNGTIAVPFVISANYRGISAQDIEIVAIDKNTIVLKALNGFIFTSFDPAALMFRNAQSTSNLGGNGDNDRVVNLGITSWTINEDKTQITMKIAQTLTAEAKADTNDSGAEPESLKVYTVNANIKDQLEQSLSIPPTLDASFYPNVKLKDEIKPMQVGALAGTGQNSDTIAMTFEEKVTLIQGINNTILAAGIEVKDGTTTLIPDVDYTASIQDGILYIKVKKALIIDKSLTIEIKRPDLIADLNGNSVIPSNATQIDHITERTSPDMSAEFYSNDDFERLLELFEIIEKHSK